MKLINFDVGKIKLNSYLKTVWTDESMEHNSYRHFGFFTSRHYGGILIMSHMMKHIILRQPISFIGDDILH